MTLKKGKKIASTMGVKQSTKLWAWVTRSVQCQKKKKGSEIDLFEFLSMATQLNIHPWCYKLKRCHMQLYQLIYWERCYFLKGPTFQCFYTSKASIGGKAQWSSWRQTLVAHHVTMAVGFNMLLAYIFFTSFDQGLKIPLFCSFDFI